jgi:ABC-type glycerol-3-phosphate transport system permease component
MPIDWFPLWLSLRVAVVSTAVALAVGLWIAYILANREFRFKEVLDALVTLPLVLPLRKDLGNDLRLASGVHLESRGAGCAVAFAAFACKVCSRGV